MADTWLALAACDSRLDRIMNSFMASLLFLSLDRAGDPDRVGRSRLRFILWPLAELHAALLSKKKKNCMQRCTLIAAVVQGFFFVVEILVVQGFRAWKTRP